MCLAFDNPFETDVLVQADRNALRDRGINDQPYAGAKEADSPPSAGRSGQAVSEGTRASGLGQLPVTRRLYPSGRPSDRRAGAGGWIALETGLRRGARDADGTLSAFDPREQGRGREWLLNHHIRLDGCVR